jgi:glycosyltransferase involved in cell wall biosynthesis
MNMIAAGASLDVIVRFHDLKRVFELKRALFSLICQSHRPIRILLCTQRFSDDETEEVLAQIADLFEIDRSVSLDILNYADEYPDDARSSLVNLGIKNSTSKYLAFLDYDDTIYPQAYEALIAEIQRSKVAIAFANIHVKRADVYGDIAITTHKEAPFVGHSLVDFFKANFCPIHSFVIDTSAVDESDIYFDKFVSRNEDYEFLMRICAAYPSSFALRHIFVGDYYLKSDGSNTVRVTETLENKRQWEIAEDMMAARRNIITVSRAVQRSLGIAEPRPNMTVRTLIDLLADARVSA